MKHGGAVKHGGTVKHGGAVKHGDAVEHGGAVKHDDEDLSMAESMVIKACKAFHIQA